MVVVVMVVVLVLVVLALLVSLLLKMLLLIKNQNIDKCVLACPHPFHIDPPQPDHMPLWGTQVKLQMFLRRRRTGRIRAPYPCVESNPLVVSHGSIGIWRVGSGRVGSDLYIGGAFSKFSRIGSGHPF